MRSAHLISTFFHFKDSKSIFKLVTFCCDCTEWFVSDLGIFVESKRPDNFGPVFSSLLPILDTPIGRLFFFLVSVLDLIQSVLLTF